MCSCGWKSIFTLYESNSSREQGRSKHDVCAHWHSKSLTNQVPKKRYELARKTVQISYKSSAQERYKFARKTFQVYNKNKCPRKVRVCKEVPKKGTCLQGRHSKSLTNLVAKIGTSLQGRQSKSSKSSTQDSYQFARKIIQGSMNKQGLRTHLRKGRDKVVKKSCKNRVWSLSQKFK